MSRRHLIGAFLASLCVLVMPGPLEAVNETGGFIESSEFQSGRVNLMLGGLETVKRWNSPDGSKWILMRKPAGTHDQLTHLYTYDGVQYQDDYFVGTANPNCGQGPCRRIACALEVADYSCRVNDIAFDTEDTLMIVGTRFKPGSKLQGFVARYSPRFPQTALRRVAVDGFDVLFQRIVRHEVSGKYIVSGNTFSSFDNEQRVIVGRLTSGEFMEFDQTFDGDGLATIDLGVSTQMSDVLVNPDGSVDLLAYTKFTLDATPLSVVRRLTNLGKPDKNFGLGGSAYPYGLSESVPVNLAAGPNSLYVLVKTWDLANQYYVPRLTRLTATGGYDTKFSGDGKADFKAFTRRTADIQENYRIRATTTSVILLRYLSTAPSLLQLYRLTATGEIDETFSCCTSVGWAEPDPNFRLEWRDADVVDDRRRIYLRTVTARAGGISIDARDYVLYSKTIDAVGTVPAAQDPVAGSTTTVVGQTPASGATGTNEGSTTDQSAGSATGSSVVAATTVSPAKDLVVRPLVRGLSVRWSSSANAGASYLVTAVYEDEIKQCQVADGVATVCNFRKLAPWKTYQVSVAAVVDGALSTGIKATAKPVVVMKPATSIKTERLVRPPRSPQLGKRTWSVRGQCRLVSSGRVLVAGSKAGICVVTLVTARSGKLPRIVRSVNVKLGKS